jgi:hypothetical protein
MTGYQSKKKAARDKLIELAKEGMGMHSPDAPEYIVCEALIEALAQPAQEPWRESASDYERGVIDGMQKQAQSSVDKAVNRMAKRLWVGLTDGVMCDIAIDHGLMSIDWIDFARAIEAKLKERNA